MLAAANRIDQMPAWAFMMLGVAAFGAARAGRRFSLLHRNAGAMELFSLITMGIFLVVVIFAVRRRQVRAWRSAVHVLGTLVVGNAFGVVLIWPFIPDGYELALAPMLPDTMVAGFRMTLVALPVSILLLWLSRKYGSHSSLTERRFRVIREKLARRYGVGRDAA